MVREMELKDVEAEVVSLEEELEDMRSRKQALQEVLKVHKTRYFGKNPDTCLRLVSLHDNSGEIVGI